jgi:hypothetical protein
MAYERGVGVSLFFSSNYRQMQGYSNPMSINCPECRHILPSGRKCHQPALSGKSFCMHHCRARNLVEANRARRHSIALPPLEDRSAVQMSIDVVLAALGAGKINRRTAATYTYAIKIGADNLAKMENTPPPEPIAICRDERGDILAAQESTTILGAPEPGAPGASHLGTGETTNAESAETNSAPANSSGAPELDSEAREETTVENSAPEPTPAKPSGAPGASHLGTGETMNAESAETGLDDLRNTAASNEYDPEPPTRPTKAELRANRRFIELSIQRDREALHYWKTIKPEQCINEDPQVVIDFLRKQIDRAEEQLKEIRRWQAPDPIEPDPPL